jgi:hypothetical protein
MFCATTRSRRYRGRHVQCTCFMLVDPFSTVQRATDPVLMFYAPGLIFGGTEGVKSNFLFCAPRLVFGGTKTVRSHFIFYAPKLVFGCTVGADTTFMFCAQGPILGSTKGVGSNFHISRYRTHFRQYRGRQLQFSFRALPDSFSAVPRVPGPIFMFCAPGVFFSSTEGALSSFYVLRSRTHCRQYHEHRVQFSCFSLQIHFRRCRGRPVQFSFLCYRTRFRWF